MSTERISVDRALLEEYAKDSAMLVFLVNVLLKADRNGGSFQTSIRELAKELGLSVRQVRTCMAKLKERHTIDTLNDTRATQITLCEYDSYSDARHTSDTPSDTRATHRKKNTPSLMVPNGSLSDSPSFTPLLFPQEESEEGDADASRKKCQIDFSSVMKMWNDCMKRKVPKVKGMSDARKEKVRVRIEEMGGLEQAEQVLAECFRKVNDSDFCNGTNEHNWVASFDWFFMNGQNWLKVYEGNYDNKRQVSRFEQSLDVAERAKGLKNLVYGTGNNGTTNGFADTPDEQ